MNETDEIDDTKMAKEFFFTKIDIKIQNQGGKGKTETQQAYIFIDFLDHIVDHKSDFAVGHITLVTLPKNLTEKPKIFLKDLNSFNCFNRAIEWNKAYFTKLRACFYRRLADINFKMVMREVDEEQMDSGGVDLKMYFQVQNQTEVLGFQAENMQMSSSWSQVSTYHQGVELIFAKISEYCRKKNKETEKVNTQRDLAKAQKVEVMENLQKFITESNQKQQVLVSKFCLLLNEKKQRISELQNQLQNINQGGYQDLYSESDQDQPEISEPTQKPQKQIITKKRGSKIKVKQNSPSQQNSQLSYNLSNSINTSQLQSQLLNNATKIKKNLPTDTFSNLSKLSKQPTTMQFMQSQSQLSNNLKEKAMKSKLQPKIDKIVKPQKRGQRRSRSQNRDFNIMEESETKIVEYQKEDDNDSLEDLFFN